MAKLVIHQPNGTIREITLDRDRISIGRRADHDICLPFPAVSADHAEIVTVIADSFLHDLGSTNGTIVNGKRVNKHFLRDHDTIDIARHQIVYVVNDAEIVEPLPPAQPADKSSNAEVEAAGSDEPENEVAALDQPTELTHITPVDELLTDLMEMESDASAAIDMPPAVSIVRAGPAHAVAERSAVYADGTAGAYIEVMSGPNAGQITPMTKTEFVLGKAGASVASIRRSEGGYRLMPLQAESLPTLNGRPIDRTGAWIEFGDTIGIGGVVLRFNRRAPL